MVKQKFGMVLPIALLAYFLILMDNSIIFTSAVEIGRDLHLTAQALSWISNAYTLTFGGFLLLSGRLSDLIGRKRIFLIGLAIFGVASWMIGLSNQMLLTILLRGVQGIGASILAPSTLALMIDAYQGNQLTTAIAYYGATAGVGSSLGLVIGGWLTTAVSWRAGFLINVPFTLLLLILAWRFIKPDVVKPGSQPVDLLGAGLSVVGLGSIIYGLLANSEQWLYLAIGMSLIGVFVWRESHVAGALMPLSLFTNKIRASAYLLRLLFMMSMLSFWFLLPQMMQSQYGFNALQAGLAFFPLTVIMFLISMRLPMITAKFGQTKTLLFGEIMLGLGMLLLALANFNASYWSAVALPMVFLGIGQGFILSPVTSLGIYETSNELAGIASGITNTMHQIGGPIGLSLVLMVGGNIHTNLWVMFSFIVVAIVTALFLVLQQDIEYQK